MESSLFNMLFFFMVFGFGNAYYILSVIEHPVSSRDKLSGPNIFTAFMFSYLSSLGDFNSAKYEEIQQ